MSNVNNGRYNELSTEPYISDDYFDKEREAIFKRYWLLAGRAEHIPNSGDFFVFELKIANASIIVVRGKDDQIRAFHNVCRHRGSKVEFHGKGCNKVLKCLFHGWVYGLDGQLLDVPAQESFEGLDISSIGLAPVSVDVWGGFLFVNLNPEPEWTLAKQMEPLPDALNQYLGDKSWKQGVGYKRVFHTNWKTLVEVQVEGYHANSLHQNTVTAAFGPDDAPTTLYPDSIGVPGTLTLLRPDVDMRMVKQTPVTELVVKYGKTAMYAPNDQSGAAADYPGALNKARLDRWVFDDYNIFPNTVFLIQEDQILIQRVSPLAKNRTLWEFDYLFANEPKNFGEVFEREQGLIQGRDTITEDMTTVEGIQSAYESGVLKKVMLGSLEDLVVSFRNLADRTVNEYEAK